VRYHGDMALLHGLLASLFPPMPEPMDELRPGVLATVRGVVAPRDVVPSPLTGEPCVYYYYTVEEWRRSGVVTGVEGSWHLIDRDEAILEFYLEQDGRRVLISPWQARIDRGRGIRPRAIPTGTSDQRAQQLLIGRGDLVEITGMVDEATDLFADDHLYRTHPARHVLRAPAGDVLQIRLLVRA
jgi:hypothetical protein